MTTIFIKPDLPWDELPEDSSRARSILLTAFGIAMVCAIVIPNVKLPPLPRPTADEARQGKVLMLEKHKEPIVIPEKKLPPPKPLEKPTEATPKPTEQPKVENTPKEAPSKHATKEEIVNATNKGQAILKNAGVADALASLRSFESVGVATAKNPSTGGGLQKNSGEPVGTSRNMITSRAGAGSGGLAYQGPASSGFGGGVAGGKGGQGNFNLGQKGTKDMKGGLIASVGQVGGANGGGARASRSEGGVGKRTTEDIRRTFDQNGGRINQAYQRALKDDPSMEGKVTLSLTIDANGKVVDCQIVSSELNNPELEAKIVALVKGFNFGEDQVDVWKGKHTLNFFPN